MGNGEVHRRVPATLPVSQEEIRRAYFSRVRPGDGLLLRHSLARLLQEGEYRTLYGVVPRSIVVAGATEEMVTKLIELGLAAGAYLERPILDDCGTKPPAQSQPIRIGWNNGVCGGAWCYSHNG